MFFLAFLLSWQPCILPTQWWQGQAVLASVSFYQAIVGKDNQAASLYMLQILLLFLFGGASHEDSRRLWLGRVLMGNFRQPSFAFVSAGRVHDASIC